MTNIQDNKKREIVFQVTGEGGEIIEVARFDGKGKFYYKGQEIDDIHDVYKGFHEWVTIANENKKSAD